MQISFIGRFEMSPKQRDDQQGMIAARTLAVGLVKTAYMGDRASLEDRFKAEKSLRFYEVPRQLHPIDQMEVLAQRIFAHYKIDRGKSDE
jgi:hypothetical protein